MVLIVDVLVADRPDAWRGAGFAVADDGSCRVGTVTIRLTADGSGSARARDGEAPPGDDASSLSSRGGTGTGRGIAGWTLAGLVRPPPDGAIDGLPTDVGELPDDLGGAAPPVHPNGCTEIDHVVVMTHDLDRTTGALVATGIEPRRIRDAGTGPDGVARRQRFFRLGEVILELVGPAEPAGTGPARFWGLAYEVADLAATAAHLGDLLTGPRDAVQPARRIASLRREAGLTVPTAFLTPDPRRRPG